MKAMILAAGRGERLRPLTDHTPKPLLPIAGKPMLEYIIEALVNAGFHDLVINLAHLGQQIQDSLGNGKRFNAKIQYSQEGDTGLETAGGIMHAMPLLGSEPFLVVNGDIATDYPFASLKNKTVDLAYLVLVNNPEHHQQGDFGLKNTILQKHAAIKYTFSGIGIYHPELFTNIPPGKTRLAPLLRQAMENSRITGELYTGFWADIGTRKRLEEIERYYQNMRNI
jgi:MurNAc alpha-1-phosphate uridylyltransferase